MENIQIVSIPIIVTIVCSVMQALKKAINKESFDKFIPICAIFLGIIIGVVAFYAYPEIIPADSVWLAAIIGAASGWAATGANQTIKQLNKK